MEIILTGVEQHVASNGQKYLRIEAEYTDEQGVTLPGHHLMPVDTLEWRAAEYGIDPAELEVLLDIVLHEPFMEEPDRPDLALHDAPDIDSAREYHIERVQRVKAKKPKAERAKSQEKISAHEETVGKIKSLVVMNAEAIELKRDRVGRLRVERREARSQLARMVGEHEAARLARIRKELAPRRLPENDPLIKGEKKDG